MDVTFTNIISSIFLGILIIGGLKKYLKYRRWCARYELIPGPKCIPILGNALEIAAKRKEVVEDIFSKFNTYGPIFRVWIGPKPTVNLCRAEDIEILLSSSKHIEKSFFYIFLEKWLGDGLLLSKGAKWHARRKLITPAFHFKILKNFYEVFNAKTDILIEILEKHINEPLNIFKFISRTTLDVICETAMGTNVNAQSAQQSDYVKAVYDISSTLSERSRCLWLFPDFTFSLSNYGKLFYESVKKFHNFTQRIIRERKLSRSAQLKNYNNYPSNDQRKRIAFLDILLEAAENGANINEKSIREEVDTFMFEAQDTTASAISFALFLLGHHPEYQEIAFQEINDILQGEDRHITMEDSYNMKYLERFIKESLRIYPPVPIIGRILEEDCQIGQYIIPGGTSIVVFIHRLHHDPRYFPEPEKCDPDRFLPENCKDRHPFAYIPFSAGSRNCIGQKFAMLEVKVVLASIVRKFKIKSIDKREDVNLLYELVLKPHEGYKIAFEKRC